MRFRARHKGLSVTDAPRIVGEVAPVADLLADLDEIDAQISRLFALVAHGLTAATSAFLGGDQVAASRVVSAEAVVDELHHGAEALVSRQLLAISNGQGPEGLSRLVLALRIVPELERSGDLVEHIAARSSPVVVSCLPDGILDLIRSMSDIGVDLWTRAGGAFGGVDMSTAGELRLLDDRLDDLHVRLCDELAGLDLPIAVAIEMGLVARFYERLGDHAVNIIRRVEESDPSLSAVPA